MTPGVIFAAIAGGILASFAMVRYIGHEVRVSHHYHEPEGQHSKEIEHE